MFETIWGKIPPGGLPRRVAQGIGAFGRSWGISHRLPPLPGAVLDWWDPHQPIEELLSHDKQKMVWYHAFRSSNPKVALLGPTMGWIHACTTAQYALEERNVAKAFTNPTLIFTAEHDTFVKASGQEAFCAAAPSCRRVLVKDAYHEVSYSPAQPCDRTPQRNIMHALIHMRRPSPPPRKCAPTQVLFESETIRIACVDAVINWLRQTGLSGDASTIGVSPSHGEHFGGGSVPSIAKAKAVAASREKIQEAGRKKFAEQQQGSIGGVRATMAGTLELVQTSNADKSFRPGRVSPSSQKSKSASAQDKDARLLLGLAVVGAAAAFAVAKHRRGN